MSTFDFVLRFRLPKSSDHPEAFVEAIQNSACADATVGVGQMGSISLDFTRSGTSEDAAMAQACVDVLQAIPGALRL